MYIAICDDDIRIAAHMKEKLLETVNSQIARADIFTSPHELMFSMEEQRFDIVFMDIELGEVSGIDLAKRILTHYPDTQIIFVSGHDDYYLDVYDVEHIYFLKKPINADKLKCAFTTACRKLQDRKNDFLSFSNKQGLFRIALKDILFLEKKQRLIHIHTQDGQVHKMYGKFPDLVPQLNPFFIQCHVSYIVNLRNVTAMEKQDFHLSNGRTIPISKNHYKEIKETFLAYLERKY
ncbi:MAG: LytTR family DNA-binding domain-containing protein [Bacillota bacterium]|nr:LytTR family DNA-binding domain-containing protein [Bacillota bacterium]